MGKQDPDSGKVKDHKNGKFTIEKGNGPNEVDLDIQLPADGSYEVKKLKVQVGRGEKDLPEKYGTDTIRWFNNFSIKENGAYIKKKYTVTITNLQEKLGNGKLVIYSETHDPKLYPLAPQPTGDTFDLDDGDPGGGAAP